MPGIVIHRTKHTEQYVIIPNTIARDKRLSLLARGILVHLLSLPDGWHITTETLAKDNRESRDAIRAAMTELRAVGYVQLHTQRGKDGCTRRHLEVFDIAQDPLPADLLTKRGLSVVGPTSENDVFAQVAPTTGKPTVGISALYRSTGEKDGLKDGASPPQSRTDHEITTDRNTSAISSPTAKDLQSDVGEQPQTVTRARDITQIIAAQQAAESRRRREASEQWPPHFGPELAATGTWG